MKLRGLFVGLALSLPVVSAPGETPAAQRQHQTEYSIRLSGLPVATVSFRSEFTGSRYSISGRMHSAGLADIFAKTQGSTSVSGVVAQDKLRASSYSVSYQSGKRSRDVDVRFRNGNVVDAKLNPPRKRSDNWIPVSSRDMRSVLDPISGLIFPADAKVCPKTLPIFDGESRMDIKLTAKGTRPFSTAGFEGEAIVCGIRFIPKSGYRKGRDDVEYLRRLTTMEIWFAKAETVNVYAPVFVRIPTKLGPVTVSATRFGG